MFSSHSHSVFHACNGFLSQADSLQPNHARVDTRNPRFSVIQRLQVEIDEPASAVESLAVLSAHGGVSDVCDHPEGCAIFVESIGCFAAGMLALGGVAFERPSDILVAKELMDGCLLTTKRQQPAAASLGIEHSATYLTGLDGIPKESFILTMMGQRIGGIVDRDKGYRLRPEVNFKIVH
eukprot:SAG11_NODE_650_length_7931_cov_9.512385_4_plen_180_part_00